MIYESTKTLLRSIVRSLEQIDRVGWDDQVESGQECLYEMYQMARAFKREDGLTIAVPKSAVAVGNLGALNRAIPYVRAMVIGIRHGDQSGALQNGRAALSQMDVRDPAPVMNNAFKSPNRKREGL